MKTLADLEEENEKTGAKLSLEEKRALIREAKKRYGNDWKKFFSNTKSGIEWSAVKFKL